MNAPSQMFAVTISGSLYLAEAIKPYGQVRLTKIALKRDSKSKAPRGFTRDAVYLQITGGFLLLVHHHDRPAEGINTRHWGFETNKPVGLFLKEEDARKCFKSKVLKDWDPRWEKQTIETLLRLKDSQKDTGTANFVITRRKMPGLNSPLPEVFLRALGW